MALVLTPSGSQTSPSCGGYRPREAFLSPLWRIVSDHLDPFLRHYAQRHENTHGPLGRHVEKVLNQFLECDPNRGLMLFRCQPCRLSLAVPYSCKTRICPSCMSRKGEHLAETLEPVLPYVPYRHVVRPRSSGLPRSSKPGRASLSPAPPSFVNQVQQSVNHRYLTE